MNFSLQATKPQYFLYHPYFLRILISTTLTVNQNTFPSQEANLKALCHFIFDSYAFS